MVQEAKAKKPNKIKQLFSQLINKIDRSMEEKAKSQSCCCKLSDKEGKSCCS